MDAIPDNNLPNGAEFSLNNFGSFYNQVFIKQEIPDEETSAHTSVSQFEELQTVNNEVKLEKPEYPNPGEAIQHEFFPFNTNPPRPVQPERLHDKFIIVRGPNNERRYGCHLCEFHTKHKVSLYRHVRLHNPEGMQSYKCDVCGFETLYRRHLDVHIKVLHGSENKAKLYKCDQCSYECNYRENLSRHKKTHLSPEERNSFVCQICDFETFYRKSYRVHMEMIHQIVTTAKSEESEFKCYHCPFETKYRVNIIRHLKTHMKGDTTIYKCTDCDFQTIHKTNFNTHVLRHKDPGKIKIFECQHCSHKTFYKASLRNHLKLHMKKEEVETYKCEICDFATIYERSLKLHVLYMHNGDHQAIEYFKCHFCDFATRYRENWRRHEKGHTRPGKQDSYNCTECSFSTIQQGRYERHLLTHASPEQLALLGKPLKKTDGRKRFRAVIDTPITDQTYALMGGESTQTVIVDDFKSQTFTDGNSPALTMFQCCHCSYKTLSKQLLDEHLSKHHVATLPNGTSQDGEDDHSRNGDINSEENECVTSAIGSDNMNVENPSQQLFQTTSSTANGKKLFDCERCPFTTIHRSSIRRHRETHLRPSERKEYKCPTCIFRSYTRARVNSHECPNRSKNIVDLNLNSDLQFELVKVESQ